MRFGCLGWGLLSGLLLAVCGQGAAAERNVQKIQPGLIAHYYGNPTFWYHAGTVPVRDLTTTLNLQKLQWPPNKLNEKTRQWIFSRQGGWSLVIRGSLTIKNPGEYSFHSKTKLLQLKLGKLFVDCSGNQPVSLAAGKFSLTLYLKSFWDREVRHWDGNLRTNPDLRWKPPAATKFTKIPTEQLTYSEADRQQTLAYTPDFLLENGSTPFFGMRKYTLSIPEDGFYKFSMQFMNLAPWLPNYAAVKIDNDFLYHYRASGAGEKLGFLNTLGTTRYLKKGMHSIRVSSYSTHLPFTSIRGFLARTRLGLSRVEADNPERTLSIYAKNRRDMVFSKNEKLTIVIEKATAAEEQYTLEVSQQRGAKEPVWTAETGLPAEKKYARIEMTYPCDTEGAFEYRVKNSLGEIVYGPAAFVVIDPTLLPLPKANEQRKKYPRILIDSVDCTLPDDREHLFRQNGAGKVVQGKAGAYRVTGARRAEPVPYVRKQDGTLRPAKPSEKTNGRYLYFDWFAYTLKVKHPQRPHLVVAYIPTEKKRVVCVQAFDQVSGQYNGAVMETGDSPNSQPFVPLRFLVWPNGKAIDVTTFCGNDQRWALSNRQGAIQRLELYEYPDGLPPLPEAAAGWSKTREFGWQGEQVNLGMEQRLMPKLWQGNTLIPGVIPRNKWLDGYYDWKALREVWERFGELARWRGDNFLLWPVHTYNQTVLQTDRMPKLREAYTQGYGYRDVDKMRRDQLKMMLLICQKYGVRFVADFQFIRMYAGNVWAANDQAGTYRKGRELTDKFTTDGTYLLDAKGKLYTGYNGAAILNPAHPLARKALINLYAEIAEKYGKYPAFGGIHIRQTNWQSNDSGWFLNSNLGYGDFTVGLFEKETGIKVPVQATAPKRFAVRRNFLMSKAIRPKWFEWRSEKVFSLRTAILKAIRKYAPQAKLYGDQEPVLAKGQGLDEALLAGRRDLGYGSSKRFSQYGAHIEYNYVDPVAYANFDLRPVTEKWNLANARALGFSYPFGMCAGSGSTIKPYPYELAEPAKFIAQKNLQTAIYGGPWILPSMDVGLRRWVQAWRAIPERTYTLYDGKTGLNEPVACWFSVKKNGLIFYAVNRTDQKRRVRIHLQGKVSSVRNLVTGKDQLRRDANNKAAYCAVTLAPYTLAVFNARGAVAIILVELKGRAIKIPARKGGRRNDFLMAQYEVTNAEYEQFDSAHKKLRDKYSRTDNQPVIYVSWFDAIKYCNWRSRQEGLTPCYNEKTGTCDPRKNGYRLPTSQEWLLAAVGEKKTLYPWGNKPPAEGIVFRCNFSCRNNQRRDSANYLRLDGFTYTSPVGSFQNYNSSSGVADLAGNVHEWCQDFFPGKLKRLRVLRGGAWNSDAWGVQSAKQIVADPQLKTNAIGFRCVRRRTR